MIKRTGLILGMILFGLSTNLFAQTQQNEKKEISEDFGNLLPSLKIETPEGIILTENDFKTKGHLFLITIHPTCGHCNNIGALINRNAELFKDSKVVFIMTPKNALNLDFFTNSSHIGDHPELIVGVDQNNTIKNLNDSGTMPYINIYKDEKLVKKMNGDVTLEEFKKYLP